MVNKIRDSGEINNNHERIKDTVKDEKGNID
jgi:hypothetical protein